MREKRSLWGFFAHTGIIVGTMFVVFFIIDRYNPAMEFLTSEISKWLILLLALCAVGSGAYSAVLLFQMRQRQEERMNARRTAVPRVQEYSSRQRTAGGSDQSRAAYASIQAQQPYPRSAMQQNGPYSAQARYPRQDPQARR